MRAKKIRKAVNEPGGGIVLSMPHCGALIMIGLCGGAASSYNGDSHFVRFYTSY
jgi:nucleoside phosphorylase